MENKERVDSPGLWECYLRGKERKTRSESRSGVTGDKKRKWQLSALNPFSYGRPKRGGEICGRGSEEGCRRRGTWSTVVKGTNRNTSLRGARRPTLGRVQSLF